MATDAARGPSPGLPIYRRSADPATPGNGGMVYSKTVGGVDQLFWIDSSGNIRQLTGVGGGGGAGSAGTPIITAIAPAAVSATAIAAAKAASNATNAYTLAGQPDYPRIVGVVCSGAGWDGGDITFVGTDPFDRSITEVITPNNSTTPKYGVKLFKTVISATKGAVGASAITASLGYGATIGPAVDREELFILSAANAPVTGWVVQPPLLADLTTARRIGFQNTAGEAPLIVTPSNSETLGTAAAATDPIAGPGELRWYRKASTTNFAIDGFVPSNLTA